MKSSVKEKGEGRGTIYLLLPVNPMERGAGRLESMGSEKNQTLLSE